MTMTSPLAAVTFGFCASCMGAVSQPGDPSSGDATGAVDSHGVPALRPEAAATMGLRRLTVDEYDNTLCDLIGDCTRPGGTRLPQDSLTPFTSTSGQQAQIGESLVAGVEFLATDVASALRNDRARWDRIVRYRQTDADGLKKFVQTFGRRALRRPLSDEEVALFLGLPAMAQKAGDFDASVELVVRAFLQDPEFVHRIEIGTEVAGVSGLFKLTPWELLSRLSYLFWGSMPTDALLDRVQAGGLTNAQDVQAVARMMASDPKARHQVAVFHEQWLGYYRLTSTLANDMKKETAALLGKIIFDDKQPWEAIFTADQTLVTFELAKNYGLAMPAGFKAGSPPVWMPYSDPSQRGILRHGSFLSLGNKFSDSSPTRRGKEIRKRLLCQEVKDPDAALLAKAGVSTDMPPGSSGSLCKWERYEINRNRGPICLSCHTSLDLVGFGLENFDNLGQYRREQYWTKDADGGVVRVAAGTPGATPCDVRADGDLDGSKFTGPAGLAGVLLSAERGPELSDCLLKRFYEFGMQRRDPDAADKHTIDFLKSRIGPDGVHLDDVLVALATSPAFAYRRVDPQN